MNFFYVLLVVGAASAHCTGKHADTDDCKCRQGCGPGFEKSYLGYGGQFRGGSARFVPVYERQVSIEKDCVVKGGKGAHGHGHKPECGGYQRYKRSYGWAPERKSGCDQDCKCECGCGPGFEKSYLGYGGKFHGGAARFVPVYERQVSIEKDCVVKGGKGAHGYGHKPDCGCHRHKRSYGWVPERKCGCEQDCKCECGCGPGFEKSYLGYGGKFHGGNRRFVPVYERQVSIEKDCVVKGGKGAYDYGYGHKPDCGCHRHKRSYGWVPERKCGCEQECKCECGCGPGFEKSHLGYDGKFHGGNRRFVPVYERQVSIEKDCVVKGGKGAYDHGCGYKPDCDCYRHKRSHGWVPEHKCGCEQECKCECGCGPGFEKSYLGYGGKFHGGNRRFVPVYERQVSIEKDCVVKGGKGAYDHGYGHKPDCGCHRYKRSYGWVPERKHGWSQDCKCECGCGPGYEKSYLGYGGKFHGGAARFVPVYERQVSIEKDCVVKGGKGAAPHVPCRHAH